MKAYTDFIGYFIIEVGKLIKVGNGYLKLGQWSDK